MKCYIVFRSVIGSYYYKEDDFNNSNTYKNKPVAIFFSHSDASLYVKERNSKFYDVEDDGPDDNWALLNGYL